MKTPNYQSGLGWTNKAGRALWNFVWICMFRFTPRLPVFWAWRRFLLRLFGAKVGRGVKIYPSARIWMPSNLEAGNQSMIGPYTDIYTVDKVVLGENAWVSQYCFLCTASHSITDPNRALVTRPIHIGRGAWVAAGAYVGPGVTIGEGSVVGARACVVNNVEPWTVVGGNPARHLRRLRRGKDPQ
jgi:putative colanic acid biosynthesis acetyltransferase WcaF